MIQELIKHIFDAITLIFLSITYFGETLLRTLTPPALRKKKSFTGKTVLITGGAGGVGQEIVFKLIKKQAKIIVWDNNETALNILQEKTKNKGYKVHTYLVDISDKENVFKHANIVKDEIGTVDILINNAGIVCGRTFLEIPDFMIEKTFRVNILSHFWTTKAFLPDMLKNKSGHIVTVSSLTGLLGFYKCTDYSASKYATIGFHESLLIELKSQGRNDIKMSAICPYFINTTMFAGCKPKNLDMLSPEQVANRIITAIEYEEEFVTIPGFARFTLPLKNFIPAKLLWHVVNKVIQAPQSMMGMRKFDEVQAA